MAGGQTKGPTRGDIAKAKGLHPFVIEVDERDVKELDHLAVEFGTKRKPLVQRIITEYLAANPRYRATE